MFDIIGKRRWFYIFSALITIPGLIFILLTPLSGGQAGLQFSIDFTGGTVWEIRFDRPDQPLPAQVREVMAEQGLDASVALTTYGDQQFVLIRTEPIGLIDAPVTASPTPGVTGSPTTTRSPGASPGVTAEPTASPTASPSPAGSPAASPTGSPAPPAPSGS
nr:hypothetical protein [Chloroflexota bacterium]